MTTGWRYRVASVVGTALLAALAIAVVNEPAIQEAFARVPYFGRPAPAVLADGELLLAISTAVVVMVATMWQLFKPRPRRILDTIWETQRRVLMAMVALAALGYFNYSYRLPRSTVMLATLLLLFVLPAYMVAIRRRPPSATRAVVVGDDPAAMAAVLEANDLPVRGYVAPSTVDDDVGNYAGDAGADFDITGGLERIGGLSRIEDVIVSNDVDTVLFAFGSTDRAEFFGTLAVCHAHGVEAKIHRDHVDSVLVAESPEGELIHVDVEPWDFQERVVKRLFDVAFSGLSLLVLSPVIFAITLAIKLDDGGPILYSQERTAEFGNTFRVYKFRTMCPGGERSTPGDEADRITRVGGFLRRTHLDEIPQLWAILTGRMSVVGPRAAWTDEEIHLEAETSTWRKRWFVKPGLTGLAQINGADSTTPVDKLRYDLQYIKRQSFWMDLKIVVRQLWQVGSDVVTVLRPPDDSGPEAETRPAESFASRDGSGTAVDGDGTTVDVDGTAVKEDGTAIDEDGTTVDADDMAIDDDGTTVDAGEKTVVTDGSSHRPEDGR